MVRTDRSVGIGTAAGGRFVAWSLVAAWVVACATSGGRPPGGTVSGDTYVNAEEGFGFRVPPGWSQVESANPFSTPPYIVRFQPPTEDARVSVYGAQLGPEPCLERANELLQEHEGARLERTESFTVDTSEGEVPAWRGVIETGEFQGGGSIFCAKGDVHVLAGMAPAEAFSRHSEDLERAIRSFAYAGAPQLVQLAPPTPTPSYFVHEITFRGQTLGQIAKWYTGDYGNWKKLTDLNGLTKHGVPLRVGRRIKIPEELVTNRKPLPRPRRKAPPKPTATPTPTPLPVIGPKF